MTAEVVFRAARPADSYAIAELSIMAGDGMYEFLLGDMAPTAMLAGLIARTIKSDQGGFSWRHCFVAEDQGIVGMVNAFPAAWLRKEDQELLPQDRVLVLDAIDQAQDWESFLVNGIAVRGPNRRRGIGERLLDWAIQAAQSEGFSRLTANVWADNAAARKLFEGRAFVMKKQIPVAEHAGLGHNGGSLLYELTFG
jgi:GNAT superfamily N-acetyltransferase